MQPLALARILGVIKSAGCSLSYNTLVDYLQYLNDAYLIFGISNFSDKLSEKESIKKRYFFDNGLLNTFIIEPESKLLENLVAIELKKRYQEGVFYYKKNVEVVFIFRLCTRLFRYPCHYHRVTHVNGKFVL